MSAPRDDLRSGPRRWLLVAYVLAWPFLIVAVAWAWSRHWAWGLAATAFVGGHVNVQLALLYHELWHNHFFRRPATNRAVYNLVSLYLLSNPQVYGLAHQTHHQHVHTWEDLEFFPRGRWSSPARARLQLALEMSFGLVAWGLTVGPIIHRHPRHDGRKSVAFVAAFALTHFLHYLWVERVVGDGRWLFVAFGSCLWTYALLGRYLQFAEHLGVIAPDRTLDERNALTRNVSTTGWHNRVWHLLTCNDTASHVQHHRVPARPNRPLLGTPRPPPGDHRTISISELPAILARYWRNPTEELAPRKP